MDPGAPEGSGVCRLPGVTKTEGTVEGPGVVEGPMVAEDPGLSDGPTHPHPLHPMDRPSIHPVITPRTPDLMSQWIKHIEEALLYL